MPKKRQPGRWSPRGPNKKRGSKPYRSFYFKQQGKRRRGYISQITGKRIARAKISSSWEAQALMELYPKEITRRQWVKDKDPKTGKPTGPWRRELRTIHPRLTEKGAKKQLAQLREFQGFQRDEVDALPDNYQRWFKWLYENTPELLPPDLRPKGSRAEGEGWIDEAGAEAEEFPQWPDDQPEPKPRRRARRKPSPKRRRKAKPSPKRRKARRRK